MHYVSDHIMNFFKATPSELLIDQTHITLDALALPSDVVQSPDVVVILLWCYCCLPGLVVASRTLVRW